MASLSHGCPNPLTAQTNADPSANTMAGGTNAKSVANQTASRSGPIAQEGSLGSKISKWYLIRASQEQSISSDRSLAGSSQMERSSLSGNVCHVTTPTPAIHITDKTSQSRNSPRAMRNAIVGYL
jgi:hypothetical protein